MEEGTVSDKQTNCYMRVRVNCAVRGCGSTNFNPCTHLIAGMLIDQDRRKPDEKKEFEAYLQHHIATLLPLRQHIESEVRINFSTYMKGMGGVCAMCPTCGGNSMSTCRCARESWTKQHMRVFDDIMSKVQMKICDKTITNAPKRGRESDATDALEDNPEEKLSTKLKRLKATYHELFEIPFPITTDPDTHTVIVNLIRDQLIIEASQGYAWINVEINLKKGCIIFECRINGFDRDEKQHVKDAPILIEAKQWNDAFTRRVDTNPEKAFEMVCQRDLILDKVLSAIYDTWSAQHPDILPNTFGGKWLFEF